MTAYLRPGSVELALAARAQHPDWTVLAGGTDLMVAADKQTAPPGILDIFGLPELTVIEEEDDGAIVVGAAAPYASMLTSELVTRELPMLQAAAREVGAAQIQARGTLGGNIGTSSPVGDSLPVLLALDAEIVLGSTHGRRRVPYHEFCTGYRTTVLGADELMLAVRFPPRPAGLVQVWRKVGTRRAQSISKVAMAAAAALEDGRISHVRIGLGAVADRPFRARGVEAAVTGKAPGEAAAEAARQALAGEIAPIDDVRSTADYRLGVAQNLVARFVMRLAEDSA